MCEYRLPDGTVPVLLSSDTAAGLRAEATQLSAYLQTHPQVTANQVADMLFRTRVARRRRALVMVDTREELLDGLRAVAAEAEHPAVVTGTAATRRIGFVFPGQGSQRPGMGKLYYELSQAYRAEVDACAAVHEERFGHTQPLHYLLGNEGRYEDTVWEVQPALMFHMAGLAAMWQAAGVRPAATVGHSQGELAAGHISGVMTRGDAVFVVTHRSKLVDQLSPRGFSMAVLGMDREDCEALLARHSGWAELAVVNSPHILAVSGDRDTIVDIVAAATAKGKFAKEIRVAYPAHTSLVAEVRRSFQERVFEEMSARTFADSEIPCYGATLGERITSELDHEQYWYWNLRNRVRFDRAIVAAASDGIDTFVEVAEHPTLQLALQENLTLVPQDPALPPRDFRVLGTSLRTAESLREFTRNLATVAVGDLGYRWEALRTESSVGLPLPDFPHTVMNPQRLWAAAGESPAEGMPGSTGTDEPGSTGAQGASGARVRPLRLAETWMRLERRSLVPPRDLLVVDHTGRCAELAAALCTAAYNHGGSGRLHTDTGAGGFDTAVILLPELPETDGPGAIEQVAEFFSTPTWLPELATVRDCWLVTVGGEAVLDDDPAPHPFHGAVSAGFRCLAAEHLGTAFRHLDLAAGQSGASEAAAVVRALHTKEEPQLALRGNGVYAKRFDVDTEPHTPTGEQNLDHVVIIGGTGTLGVEFGEHYAGLGARRITLLSRSGETPAVAGRLRAIRAVAPSADIDVAACDVTDPAAVATLAETLRDRPASLIVHAAVNYVRAELADVTGDKMREMAGSKIYGTDNVLRMLPRTPDCRVVLCSSFAATLGGRGQLLYATVNRMLDVLARRLRAQGVDALSVQWGLWDLTGPLHAVGVGPVEAAGAVAMAPEDALTVGFGEHADLPGAGNRVVAAADWHDLHAMLSAAGFGPLLERVLAHAQEPETVVAEPIAAEPSEPEKPGGATLSEQVRVQLGKVMGTDGLDALDSSVPLVALGLDSLQALDFRKRVQSELNRDLPVAAILGGASLDDVVRLMAADQA
ncbi:nocobactin polyketide synthase NbtC [Nocardia transvalensis]|uniref:nocobactin polyketide synthase NbtC n=1 Tax=Nocardia transvalensis TaxID=37333 RepID=UPI00189624FB|nr:nocobactin polyketide synthase NbtC [Nocardia transvalensis]MBF6327583.1 nocobactin polyketide synthase NbtC [Nocardia transvalensis]